MSTIIKHVRGSAKTKHRGEFRRHAIAHATKKPQGFEVNVLAAHTHNEVAKVFLDGIEGGRGSRGIENLE